MRLIFACFILLFPYFAAAQSAAPADAALPATHATAIANALKGLPKQRSLSADDRKQAEDLLNQAQADETQADELARQWQTLRETADSADDTAAKIDAALAQDDSDALDAWKKNLPVHASTDQLETMLATERSALTAAHSAVTALDAEMRHQSARPAQVRDELTAAYASADAAQTSAPHKGESAPLASARTLRAQAAERLATVQIALLELENRSYEPRMRLLSSQLRQRQRTIGELNAHVSTLEAMVLNRTDEYVDTLRTRVMQQAGQMPPNAHMLVDAANTNVTLTNQLAQTIARLSDLRTQKQELDATRQETEQALENTNERIRIGGVSEAVGLILLAEQRKLKPVSLLKRQLAELQTELAGARMDLISVRERQSALTDIDGIVDRSLARLPNLPDERRADVRSKLRDSLDLRAEIVAQLTAQLRRLADTLSDVEQEQTEVTNITSELSAKLEERLLWTPSHARDRRRLVRAMAGRYVQLLCFAALAVGFNGAVKDRVVATAGRYRRRARARARVAARSPRARASCGDRDTDAPLAHRSLSAHRRSARVDDPAHHSRAIVHLAAEPLVHPKRGERDRIFRCDRQRPDTRSCCLPRCSRICAR